MPKEGFRITHCPHPQILELAESIPVSRFAMPIGLQIIGKHFDEATLLRVAHHYEQATEWHKKTPSIEDR